MRIARLLAAIATVEPLESRTLLSALPWTAPDGTDTLFDAEFNTGKVVDASLMHQPTWRGNGDGTFLGQTQLTVTQDGMPIKQSGGMARMTLNKWTPSMLPGQPAFHGTQLTTNDTFQLGADGSTLTFTWRAKLNTTTKGMVVGLFVYYFNPDGTHDEIDFELVTNWNGTRSVPGVNTNVYSDEALGVGIPQFVSIPKMGKPTGFHTYSIQVSPTSVIWMIDGSIVRTETDKVPSGPVQGYINMWVPGREWPDAYNVKLKPVSSKRADQQFSASVDYFRVTSVTPEIPFTVTDASVQSATTEVDQGNPITANGTVLGTGNGTVNYAWMVQGDNDANPQQISGLLSANMMNGSANIPDFTGLPVNVSGPYQAWIDITDPDGEMLSSDSFSYSVNYVAPGISFTYVPPLGNGSNVTGIVTGGNLSEYAGVALYLHVPGYSLDPSVTSGWWTKPYFTSPLTSINANGTWSADVVTGGIDLNYGVEIIAYLIPVGFDVPTTGGGTLPASLSELLFVKVSR